MDNVETHGVFLNDESDEGKRLVYRLRDILEKDAQDNEVGRYLNEYILPAEVWISLAAKVIFNHCNSSGEIAVRNDMPGGKLWKGKVGFSIERRDFWKQRLGEMSGNNEASEKTRSIASKMNAKMIATESEL